MSDTARRLTAASARLANVSDTPRLDAELLAAHSGGVEREALLLDTERSLPASFEAFVERRAAGEPIAYIVGRRAFWTIELMVGPGVLIPRADSETLLDEAVAHFAGTPGPARVLDLGTGPGTLLLAALDEWPDASGLGIDLSSRALAFARRNADALRMTERANFQEKDFAAVSGERFDLVLANPPYIAEGDPELAADVAAHEPREALMAGSDGLDAYRVIVPRLRSMMTPEGTALLEIGHRQAAVVSAMVEAEGLRARVARDLAGRDRVVAATIGDA